MRKQCARFHFAPFFSIYQYAMFLIAIFLWKFSENLFELILLLLKTMKFFKHVKTEPTTEKDGGGSQTSESSLESSSGYGSQTTLPHSQSGHNQNAESTSTIAGAPSTACILARRGSMQQTTRPPPPTRRTSAIIGSNYAAVPILVAPAIIATCGSTAEDSAEMGGNGTTSSCVDETENLPPPPAFLLESSSPTLSPTPQR